MILYLFLFVLGVGVVLLPSGITGRFVEMLRSEGGIDLDKLLDIPRMATFSPHIYGKPVLLEKDGEPAGLLLATLQANEGTLLFHFDLATQRVTWRSGPFGKDAHSMVAVAGGQMIYVVDQDQISAVDQRDGSIRWRSFLAEKVQFPCEGMGCVLLQQGYVVTLARDGSVEGFRTETGEKAWTRTLGATPRQLYSAGGLVGVIDRDSQNQALIYWLDATNGDVVYQLAPDCTVQGRPFRVGINSEVVLAPDRTRLFVLDDGSDGCGWAYDLAGRSQVWAYTPGNERSVLPWSWSFSSLGIGEDALYYVIDEGEIANIHSLHMGANTHSILYSVGGYDLEIQTVLGDLLLLEATPTYAYEQLELWAIDRTTGELRWKVGSLEEHALDSWNVHAGKHGIFVNVCRWQGKYCTFRVIDPLTGLSVGETRQDVKGSATGVAWDEDTAYMVIWGSLYGVDLATAQVRFVWP
jgi:outer membrane protein assembly factor BamB